MEDIEALKNSIILAISETTSLDGLEELRVFELGKSGRITNMMKSLGNMKEIERKIAGKELNILKQSVSGAIEKKKQSLLESKINEKLELERIDVTLPPRARTIGKIHPISQTIDEVVSIFGEMGFSVAEGPDIEEDWYNFTALNIPPDHPARQEHDTFYLEAKSKGERMVLRTHTSPVQVRTMESTSPPIRIIVPGRTYRCDHDSTHSPMFHQVEGLVVDESTNMSHLKGCLIEFCRAFFSIEDLPVRFRPSYFPFTEPSAEVDIGCSITGGTLKIGHGDKWMEILGSGMVNPRVLENCGIDSKKYQGFAFGMGIERISMLKYGIPDLRTFYDSDIRWMRHYGFRCLDVPTMVGKAAR